MNLLINQRLLFSVLLFSILFFLAWPLYQYLFDVDGIGYIGAAKQYAAGNFSLAVNGYWSPLHSWIVLPLLKTGLQPEDAFKLSNYFLGIGCIFIIHLLLNKIELDRSIKSAIQYSFVVILLSYAYYELAADLLLVFILLILFNVLLSIKFTITLQKSIFIAVIGTFAYFAKSYAFPFFILYFILLFFTLNSNRKLSSLFIGLAVFFLLSFVWIYILHWKYGEWMIAHGKNNYANWGQEYRSTVQTFFLPPPYEGSPAIWEDPWKTEKLIFKKENLLHAFIHQARIILFNVQAWFKSLNEISFLSVAIIFLSFLKSITTKDRFWIFILLTVLSLSSGYLLLHVETRFLWPLSVLIFIGGAKLLSAYLSSVQITGWKNKLVWTIFCASFLLEPVNSLKDNIHNGKEWYALAQQISNKGLKGSFAANKNQGECMVLAYRTGNSFYTIARASYSTNELLTEIENNKIRHYFFFYDNEQEKEAFMNGAVASKASAKAEIKTGMIVFSFY